MVQEEAGFMSVTRVSMVEIDLIDYPSVSEYEKENGKLWEEKK